MKLSVVADVCKEVYYNGRPLEKRLDRRDFLQLAKAANGEVCRLIWFEERDRGDLTAFFSALVEMKESPVLIVRREKTVDLAILTVPSGLGIWNIFPVSEDENEPIDYKKAFTRIKPGSSWLNSQERMDEMGLNGFMMRGGKPILLCESCVKRVAIEGMFSDTDFDLPEVVAWRVINNVLGITLKVAGFPVDLKMDGDPNVDLVKKKITELQ